MRGIFIPENNIGFIVTHRSGSRLILSTLKYFFDAINKKYEYIDYNKIHLYTNKTKKTKFYIITRHPVERFVSGFTWLLKNAEEESYIEYITKFNIRTIEDYIRQYAKIMSQIPNAHFLPQTYGILSLDDTFGLDEFETINFRRKFDLHYFDYKIIHLEDIDQMVTEDIKSKTTETIENTNGLISKLPANALRIFDVFSDYSNETCFTFNSIYVFFKDYLEKNHNANNPVFLQTHDYQYLMDFFYNEIIFYGYNNFDLNPRVIKPDQINLKNFL